ncbi:hypothetical protein [Synechocystis sp. LKSZ1]|uniref:hypothetical protein n=1 Tax=Synechocystis sp. LKSZ1 TaxID=3144951 RepID=UPI00336BBCC3
MKILFVIAHYYKYEKENALYASLRGDKKAKLDAILNCILYLHYNFGSAQTVINWGNGTVSLVNQNKEYSIDIVVCTSGDCHLLNEMTIPENLFHHHLTNAEPLLLGFECHELLYKNIGQYDYYCYLEDDIIIQDPLFFNKLNWFNFGAGDECLLQPNRYEISRERIPLKTYIDGDLSISATQNFQNIEDDRYLEGDLLTIPVTFVRPLNPHSGCFFLNKTQLEYWSSKDYFLDRDTRFVGPLESAATLGIMKTFKVYKTIDSQPNLFEVMHWGSHYLNKIDKKIQLSKGGSPH